MKVTDGWSLGVNQTLGETMFHVVPAWALSLLALGQKVCLI